MAHAIDIKATKRGRI